MLSRFSRPSLSSSPLHRRPFITVFQKYIEAYKRYGFKDCLWKMYNPGDIKFGYEVGKDAYGHVYYEDPSQVHGQTRWCEYKLKTFDPIVRYLCTPF